MDIKQRTGIAAGEYKRRRRQLMDMAGEDAIRCCQPQPKRCAASIPITRSGRTRISST